MEGENAENAMKGERTRENVMKGEGSRRKVMEGDGSLTCAVQKAGEDSISRCATRRLRSKGSRLALRTPISLPSMSIFTKRISDAASASVAPRKPACWMSPSGSATDVTAVASGCGSATLRVCVPDASLSSLPPALPCEVCSDDTAAA